jgi:hypothetical protein
MKILIVGNANSIYVKCLIEKTLINFNDNVSILTVNNSVYADYYYSNKVKIFDDRIIKNIFRYIRVILSIFFNPSNKFDIVSFQFCNSRTYLRIPLFKLISKRVIVSYWGSDILRIRGRNYVSKKMLSYVDDITFVSSSLISKFNSVFGNKFDNKIHLIDFGCENLDYISKKFGEEDLIREKYNIDSKKTIISIGYNNSPAQQHLEVIKQLSKFDMQALSNIHIIVRLTYGNGDKEYVDSIKQLLTNLHCTSTIVEQYLNDEKIAELTLLSDIFIHAQTTDALSASVCEHLYSKCLVFNPSWIKYKELENKVFYIQYKDFDDLYNKLIDCLERKKNSRYLNLLENNSKEIYNLCSWESKISGWRKLFSQCL